LKHWALVEVQKLNGPKRDMLSESCKTEVSEVLHRWQNNRSHRGESRKLLWRI